jgi:hypothetical protein
MTKQTSTIDTGWCREAGVGGWRGEAAPVPICMPTKNTFINGFKQFINRLKPFPSILPRPIHGKQKVGALCPGHWAPGSLGNGLDPRRYLPCGALSSPRIADDSCHVSQNFLSFPVCMQGQHPKSRHLKWDDCFYSEYAVRYTSLPVFNLARPFSCFACS